MGPPVRGIIIVAAYDTFLIALRTVARNREETVVDASEVGKALQMGVEEVESAIRDLRARGLIEGVHGAPAAHRGLPIRLTSRGVSLGAASRPAVPATPGEMTPDAELFLWRLCVSVFRSRSSPLLGATPSALEATKRPVVATGEGAGLTRADTHAAVAELAAAGYLTTDGEVVAVTLLAAYWYATHPPSRGKALDTRMGMPNG